MTDESSATLDEAIAPTSTPCPECSEPVALNAEICLSCGADLTVVTELPAFARVSDVVSKDFAVALRQSTEQAAIIAVIWSFFFPGIGQFYLGDRLAGVFFLGSDIVFQALVWSGVPFQGFVAFYAFFIVWALLRAVCCIHAYTSQR